MPRRSRAIGTLIFSIIVLLQVGGCKDSGSVGSSFPGSGADVQVDTLELSQLQGDTLSAISGSLNLFSTGRYQDPVFGDISATALIRPDLEAKDTTRSIDADTRMQLRLAISKDDVYGDTLAAQQYDVVELANIFRGNEINIDDDVQTTGAPVGSFTVTNEDTVTVDLSSSWVQKYGAFYNDTTSTRDSSYVRQFPGLAIVPQNSAKIIAINPGESKILATNLNISEAADSTVSDSLSINFEEWAFTADRTNVTAPDPGSQIIHNTLERVFRFNFDFSRENLGARNISQVKLVFYRDNTLLNSSPLGTNVVRPTQGSLRLHLVEGDELPQSIDPGNALGLPTGTGFYQSDDGAYYIDITGDILGRFLENVSSDQTFYVTFSRNNGALRSSIIFNDQAGSVNSPKVIITSTKTENN
ncbi:MAG: hypothetical protein JXR26_01530 [Balneolaceae bacterium]|nr:hypothetical protein [Balneolaceae bacterium]